MQLGEICLQTLGLQTDFEKKFYLFTLLYFLVAFQVHERDPWSKLICHRCAFKIREFYNFRELCVKTDAYLKAQVSWEQPCILQHIPAERVR